MTEYMLSVHTGTSAPRQPMTPEQQRQGYERIAELEAEMEAAGAFVYSARLSARTPKRRSTSAAST